MRKTTTASVRNGVPDSRYFSGLGLLALLGMVVVTTVGTAPMAAFACMIMALGFAAALLLGDAPVDADNKPIPSGAAAMAALYEEIERERAAGRVIYPFGNWVPRHRKLHSAWCAVEGVTPRG